MKVLTKLAIARVTAPLLLLAAGCGGCGSNNGPGDVMVIGDSISAYSDQLKQILGPKGWNVRRIKETSVAPLGDNARNTNYTLDHVQEWISEQPKAKVIIWNNGMWDMTPVAVTVAHQADGTSRHFHTTDVEYANNLVRIAQILRATGARVIFVTTTEVVAPNDGNFEYGREVVLNQIARQVLAPFNIEILDLYAFTKGHIDWHQDPTNIHFSLRANQQHLGPFVAAAIEREGRNDVPHLQNPS